MGKEYEDAVVNANAANDLSIYDHARLERDLAALKVDVADMLTSGVRPDIIVFHLSEYANMLKNRVKEAGRLTADLDEVAS